MHILKAKKGLSLPTVLGIVAFLIGTTATFLSYVVFQSRVVDQSLERTENYQNAVQRIDATLSIIERDRNLDPAYIAILEAYMNVQIIPRGNIYEVTTSVTSSKSVRSYFATSVSEVDSYDYLFQYTGEETGFELSPLITPTSLISSYVPTFIEQNFHWVTPKTEFTDFDSVMNYFYELSSTNTPIERKPPSVLETAWDPTAWWHWLMTDSVEIPYGKNLTIPSARLLVIDGDLTMYQGSTLTGNIVVNGNVYIKNQRVGKKISNFPTSQSIKGTIYAKGDVIIGANTEFGTMINPSFIFAEGDVTIGNKSEGNVYVLAENINVLNQGNIHITGGVYGMNSDNMPDKNLDPFTNFNTNMLYDYAIPTTITVSSSEQGEVEDDFVFTNPKVS